MDEVDSDSVISLPKSLKAFGTTDFDTTLTEEIYDHAEDFPLEACMDNGGWPDMDSMEITISDVTDDDEAIHATVTATFDEQTRHSGCADLEDHHSRTGEPSSWKSRKKTVTPFSVLTLTTKSEMTRTTRMKMIPTSTWRKTTGHFDRQAYLPAV